MVAPLKVGVAGLGNVGAAVVRLIRDPNSPLAARCGRPVEVAAVCARDKGRDRGFPAAGLRWFDDPVALARDPGIDVFVELIGGEGDPAKAAVETALAAGKSVVTANKALLARHGVALAALAEKNGVALNFEAAVAGAIPVVKALREGLAGNTFARVYGILNGTCNYILTRMELEKLSFADCLKDAQRLGYAEADPTFDVEGFDTAQKLAILASLAFGTKVEADAVYVEGISSITPADLEAADELGYRVKLLGVAVRTAQGIEQRVHPTMVPKDSAIAQVMGVTNAVTLDVEGFPPVTLVGPGAGGAATASAVVADIGDVARGHRLAPFGRATGQLTVAGKAPMQRHEGGYYIRLLAVDRPGTAATIATRLAEQQISLESIVQRHRGMPPAGGQDARAAGAPVPVILITYATTEDAVRRALEAVKADKVISGEPQLIRIEKNR
ncbi:MAG: homoserine dehydrogenase [Alphaproteobacteria bacterium]|nr:MAG: homoserine dehydrogenase [Alphaproteobacteria bacterium]